MQHESPGHPTRLIDVVAVVERWCLARKHRLHQRVVDEIELDIVVLVAEAKLASVFFATQGHATEHVEIAQIDLLRHRLMPVPIEHGNLPRQHRGVVEDEHAAEIDADVRAKDRVPVPEQVAFGHHPRVPDGLGPPPVVGLGRVEHVVFGNQPPLIHGHARSTWS